MRGAEQQMEVVLHENVGIQEDAGAPDAVGKLLQKAVPIIIGPEDVLTPVAARNNVIEGIGKVNAQWSGHGGILRQETSLVKLIIKV